jgi:excisionase family DNA binding protein
MNEKRSDLSLSSDGWLSLDEAARRLGVSRLRVREAIAAGALPARRDNHGFWRISLEHAPDAPARLAGARVAPQQLVELLFDEIEEMSALLGERSEDVAKLAAIVERQQTLMERMLRLAENAGPAEDGVPDDRLATLHERSQGVLDRALAQLETRDAELTRVTGVLDRAMDAATALDAEVARQTDISHRQRALLDRVFAIAQASVDRIAPAGRGWFSRWRSGREDGK